MRKLLTSLLFLPLLVFAQKNVQKNDSNVVTNGSIVIGNNTTLSTSGTGSIVATSLIGLPPPAGHVGEFIATDGVVFFYTPGSGSGTVTSVGLSLPNIFTVTNSPVTATGTLTATLASQNANLVWASPNGSSGTPVFRALVANDIPSLTLAKISDAGTAASHAATDFASSGAATASGLTMSTGKLLGRTTAGTGAIEQITPSSNLSLAAGGLDLTTALTGINSITATTSLTLSGGSSGVSLVLATGSTGVANLTTASTTAALQINQADTAVRAVSMTASGWPSEASIWNFKQVNTGVNDYQTGWGWNFSNVSTEPQAQAYLESDFLGGDGSRTAEWHIDFATTDVAGRVSRRVMQSNFWNRAGTNGGANFGMADPVPRGIAVLGFNAEITRFGGGSPTTNIYTSNAEFNFYNLHSVLSFSENAGKDELINFAGAANRIGNAGAASSTWFGSSAPTDYFLNAQASNGGLLGWQWRVSTDSFGTTALVARIYHGNGTLANSGLQLAGTLQVNGTTASTSTSTGSATFGGGVGVAGAFYAAGIVNAQSGTASTSTTTGAVVVTGGLGVSGDTTLGGVINAGQLVLTSTGTNNNLYLRPNGTGAVQIDAGAGLNVGAGNVTVSSGNLRAGQLVLTSTATNNGLYIRANGTAPVHIDAGAGLSLESGTLSVTTSGTHSFSSSSAILSVSGTTASTTTTTGSLVNAGGFGNAGDFHNGGNVLIDTAGKTLSVKSGANAAAGTVTLVAGAATITSTAIDANTVILFSEKTAGGTPGVYQPLASVSSGSAAVTSAATDISTYNWVALKVN